MQDFIKRINRKLRHIQRSDDQTKKKWLILISSISVVVVIMSWFLYLNLSLPKLENPEEKSKVSFFTVFGRGLGTTISDIKNQLVRIKGRTVQTFDFVKSQIEKPNEFILEGKREDFTKKSSVTSDE